MLLPGPVTGATLEKAALFEPAEMQMGAAAADLGTRRADQMTGREGRLTTAVDTVPNLAVLGRSNRSLL